jgi:hypothetical protein
VSRKTVHSSCSSYTIGSLETEIIGSPSVYLVMAAGQGFSWIVRRDSQALGMGPLSSEDQSLVLVQTECLLIAPSSVSASGLSMARLDR